MMKMIFLVVLGLLFQPDVRIASASCAVFDDEFQGRVIQFEMEVVGEGSPGSHVLGIWIVREDDELMVVREEISGDVVHPGPAVFWPDALEWGREYQARVMVDAEGWLNEPDEENNTVWTTCVGATQNTNERRY